MVANVKYPVFNETSKFRDTKPGTYAKSDDVCAEGTSSMMGMMLVPQRANFREMVCPVRAMSRTNV